MNEAVNRIVDIVEAMGKFSQPMSMEQIIKSTEISKATAYRLVAALCDAGMLLREPRNLGFSPGHRLNAISLALMSGGAFRSERRSILQTLVSQIGETCNFTTLHNDSVYYVDRVESAWPLRLSLRPGSTTPLFCTSSGKLYLSLMPAAQRKRLLFAAPIPRFTPKTITDPHKLEAQLREIRKSRVSMDDEGYLAGMISVAVPVYGADKILVGAVAVHALTARLSLDRAMTYLAQIRRAAADLGAAYRRLSMAAED